MKVARLHGAGDVRLADAPTPTVGPGEELVRVDSVGICGSDLHWFTEGGIGDARLDEPLVIGHEMAGTVVGGDRDGQRVAIDPAIPCRACTSCREGDVNLCPAILFAGHGGTDGGLRELLTWPGELLHPLPDVVSDDDGVMLEPLGVAIHALDLGHLAIGGSVVVVGCGPIGLLLVQLARIAGATHVLAIEPLEHRRDAALRLGADDALAGTDGIEEVVAARTGGRGYDLGFEVTHVEDGVEPALRAVRPGARVVLVGIPDGDRTTFPASLARRKGLTLVLARRMQEPYPRAIELVEHGRIDVRSIVTHRFGLDEVAEALATASARRGGKVVVHPTAPRAHEG